MDKTERERVNAMAWPERRIALRDVKISEQDSLISALKSANKIQSGVIQSLMVDETERIGFILRTVKEKTGLDIVVRSCMYCGSIQYVGNGDRAGVTSSICPDCMKRRAWE